MSARAAEGVAAGEATERRPGLIAAAWWMTGSHLVAQAVAYLSLIYLARLLPPAGFGTVAVGTALVSVLVLVVDHGTYGALVVHSGPARGELRRAFWRCLLVAVVLAAGMAGGARFLVDTFADGGAAGAIALLAVCLPLHAAGIVPTAMLHRSMQFRRFAGVNAIANIGSAVCAVGLGMAGFGVWALASRQVALFALLALAAAVAGRGEPVRRPDRSGAEPKPRSTSDGWFFLFGVALVLTANGDTLVVGNAGDAALAGLYALAFTIGMAPATHFAAQVGKVQFAAIAADPASSGRRTEQAVTLMCALLLPLVPAGILLAPSVLPALLGPQWTEVVIGFQLLLVMGVGYSITNCIGETLSGNGNIAFRAKLTVGRCVGTLVALWIFVRFDGIRGAGLAHLAVFLPVAFFYAPGGARRAGTSARVLGRCLMPVAGILILQAVTTALGFVGLRFLGASSQVSTAVAAALGLAVAGVLVWVRFRSLVTRSRT